TGAATMDRPGVSSRQVRSSASSNINYGNRRGTTGAINTGNRANINRGNINSGNINTGDINVKVDNRRYYGWGGYYRPVATGVAVGVATAAVIGSYYSTLPTGCVLIYRGSLAYYRCGSVWYQPVYSGMHVQYVVVAAP
ncbi:MAG TPA: hypothetical protein VFO36_00785, partial [Nitrospiraceae bacterium]|nr:hypothetical protein [Nitrospiraceae bacterium]